MFVRVEALYTVGGTYWAQTHINVQQITRVVRRAQIEGDEVVAADVFTTDGAVTRVKLGDVATATEPDVQARLATLTTGGSLIE